jgi:glycerophosphoryl diester phosphodiesterase
MKLLTCIRQSAVTVIITLGMAIAAKVLAGDVLLSAHAHNDYEHPHPLWDALAQGFDSVEADIWLVDGQLLVAHNRADAKVERTLQALYLDPLRERVRQNGGHVFTNAASFTLMIDVKSEAEATYVALRQVLLGYTNILTSFTESKAETNALTIILSGNRSLEIVAAEPLRYAAMDGRLVDIKTNLTPQLIPLISENWMQHFKWRGRGAFPDDEKIKLRQLVDRVHQQHRRLRFWAIPDTLAGWRELHSAGVDIIGTDDLVGLAKFLQSKQL